MIEKKYCVYRHVAPNGKVYIGITSLSPNNRFRNGKGYKDNEYFTRAIKKYGWDSFRHEIIEFGLCRSDACESEIRNIRLHKSDDKDFGYNISPGGEGGLAVAEETRRKIGLANKGRVKSKAEKIKMSERMRGNKYMFGVRHTAESKEKMCGPRSSMVGDKNPKARAVVQIKFSGEIVKIFPSACLAEKEFTQSAHNCNVSKCCRREAKTAYGFIWRYADEQERVSA